MAKVSHHRVRALAAVVERMAGDMGDHPVARQLRAEVSRLSNGAAALDGVNANRSPLETEEAHAVKVATLARKFDREVTAVMNRIGEIASAGAKDVQHRIDQKIDLKPDAFAGEIRAAFRSLNSAGRAKLVNELVEGNRGPELAAIVKAPGILTGISDDQRARYEEMIISKHAPAELAERAGLDAVLGEGIAAAGIAAGIAKEFIDPGKLARIEREASAASEAGAAFDQSLQ